jgi:hypothetical protein
MEKSQFTDFENFVKTPCREKGISLFFAKRRFDEGSGTKVADAANNAPQKSRSLRARHLP